MKGSGWRNEGLCNLPGEDPELWYPDGYTGRALAQAEEARSVCLACPVRGACLEDALAYEDGKSKHYRFGVAGGMFPGERAREAYRRKAVEEAEKATEQTAEDGAVAA